MWFWSMSMWYISFTAQLRVLATPSMSRTAPFASLLLCESYSGLSPKKPVMSCRARQSMAAKRLRSRLAGSLSDLRITVALPHAKIARTRACTGQRWPAPYTGRTSAVTALLFKDLGRLWPFAFRGAISKVGAV